MIKEIYEWAQRHSSYWQVPSMSALIAKASLLETVKSYLERILQQECSHMPLILHYEAAHRDLRPWLWYVGILPLYGNISSHLSDNNFRPLTDASKRLKPEQFCKYRETHYFHGPACLCGFLDGKVDYIESAFYVDSKLGYVAACSENRCGYRGKRRNPAFRKVELTIHEYCSSS